jgi:hypothetical protein
LGLNGTYIRTPEHRIKMSESLRRSSAHKIAVSSLDYKNKKREESLKRNAMPPHLKGELNGNWKGGISKLNNSLQSSFKYRQWRSDIFSRDNFTCQDCGDKTSGNLEAHHLKSKSLILQEYEITTLEQSFACDELWNLNNGITLCVFCHRQRHQRKD